jgi:hypothetical protein
MSAAKKEDTSSDLLAQESRQLNRLYGGNKLNQAAASQQSVDYYDYYDYGPAANPSPQAGGKLGGGGGLGGGGLGAGYGNGQQLAAGRKSFQQRNGQLNKLGGAASSGYGSYSGHHASYSGDEYCDNGISIALLLTALLGIAVMFYVLYVKITKGRRRRRATEELDALEENMNPIWFAMDHFQDFVFTGTNRARSCKMLARIGFSVFLFFDLSRYCPHPLRLHCSLSRCFLLQL